MIADSAARARALDTSTSFIVQAPAGSGKTELLIQRYLKLLEQVESPSAIVAITFTRKAAGEMRARVLEALHRAKSGAAPAAAHQRTTFEIARGVLDRDRALAWNLLENPAQMRIETIDALCASITRRMPWLARFGAMPEIVERAQDLYREAAQNTLAHVEEGYEALIYLLLHLDNKFANAEHLLVLMLEKRDQWLRLTGVNPDFEAVRATLEGTLERVIVTSLRRLADVFPADAGREIASLRGLDRFPQSHLADLDGWRVVADLLLTEGGAWRKAVNRNQGFLPGSPAKTRAERLLARLRDEDELLEALQQFRKLPAPRFTESQWQAMQSIVSVITLAAAELQLVFAKHGSVDFTELSIRASDALGRLESPSDLALALGERIEHILVDEFQDTSFTQFELLRKLTAGWEPGDGRTLFLVGDPMQSIYRFRQADVSLFSKAGAEGIGAVRLERLALSVNFRSNRRIVDWVNQTFAEILAGDAETETGEVSFVPSTAAMGQAADADESRIDVHGFVGREAEAERVIELVRQAGAGAKVAILVRARSHLIEIAAALKRYKIRFQAIEIDQLGERPVIEDLMALTFALLHPADRVSWLAILRAPWCGLSLADLHALASSDHSAAIVDLIQRPQPDMSADGAARIGRIISVLERGIAERGRRPLREWVESVWMRLGGPACVEDETALEDAAAYFDLLETVAEGADLSNFEWFRDQVNELFAQPDTQADDSLQLMTIHKAKGLEFDVVILPGLGSTARLEDPSLLQWLEERGELLLAPISAAGRDTDPIYEYLSHVDRLKGDQESRRLLYVATTRARSRLHLLGALEAGKDGTIGEPPSRSFLKLLWPFMAPAFADLKAPDITEAKRAPRTIRRVPADWKTPAPPPAIEWRSLQAGAIAATAPSFEWVGPTARHAGTAVHAILLRIAREGLESWDESAIRSRRNLYRSLLVNLGVAPDESKEAVERVESALLRTLRDERGRWILDRHLEGESEYPVTGLDAGKLYSVVIDRTFVDEAGVRWIIDYKIGTHQGGDLARFLDSEVERYRDQLERYARLLMLRDPRPTRLALYFPLLGGWREWEAPASQTKHARQATLFEL